MTALLAAAAILATWLLMAGLLVGVGLLLHWLFAPRKLGTADVLTAFWMGLAVCVAALQLWHFALPVTGLALVPLALVAVAGLFVNLRALRHWLGGAGAPGVRRWLLGLALLLLWLANHAAGQVFSFDTGLYHLPYVRWAQEYPVVPGHGNLHGRFAFNSASLLYHAVFDAGPWRGRAEHLTNGLLGAALLAQAAWAARRLTSPAASLAPAETASAVFDLAVAPLVIDWAMWWELSSFSTDVPAAAALVAASSRLVAMRVAAARGPEERAWAPVAAATLFTLAAVLKLSAAVVALLGALAALLAWSRARRGRARPGDPWRRRTLGWGLALSAGLALPWLARGAVLSGYPLYPSGALALPVPWRVPAEQVAAERAWIAHLGRVYYDPAGGGETRLGAPWLGPWLAHLPERDMASVLLPAALALLAAGALLVRRRGQAGDTTAAAMPAWLLLAPVVAGLAFWLVSAPNPRFGSALVWMLAAALAAEAAAARALSAGARRRLGVAGLALLAAPVASFALASLGDGRPDPLGRALRRTLVPPGPDRGLHTMPRPKVERYTTRSGLEVLVPAEGNRRWDAPLPCTPHPTPGLRLRAPGSLRSGFVTDGEAWEPLRFPSPESGFLEWWRGARAERR